MKSPRSIRPSVRETSLFVIQAGWPDATLPPSSAGVAAGFHNQHRRARGKDLRATENGRCVRNSRSMIVAWELSSFRDNLSKPDRDAIGLIYELQIDVAL